MPWFRDSYPHEPYHHAVLNILIHKLPRLLLENAIEMICYATGYHPADWISILMFSSVKNESFWMIHCLTWRTFSMHAALRYIRIISWPASSLILRNNIANSNSLSSSSQSQGNVSTTRIFCSKTLSKQADRISSTPCIPRIHRAHSPALLIGMYRRLVITVMPPRNFSIRGDGYSGVHNYANKSATGMRISRKTCWERKRSVKSVDLLHVSMPPMPYMVIFTVLVYLPCTGYAMIATLIDVMATLMRGLVRIEEIRRESAVMRRITSILRFQRCNLLSDVDQRSRPSTHRLNNTTALLRDTTLDIGKAFELNG